MNKLVSVVVPIYMVEDYLHDCINSIQKQTYKNIEIILVDDGSKDNSGAICDEYEKQDSRINVIHKCNGGLSSARNAGLKIAKGDFITFIDSDDIINENYIYDAMNIFENEPDVDVVQCKNKTFSQSVDIKINESDGTTVILNNQSANESLSKFNDIVTNLAWDKVYKIELFDDITYPEGKIHEDEYTTYKIIYKVNKMAVINKINYYYRQRANSIKSSKFNIKRIEALEAYEQRMLFYKQNDEEILYDNTVNVYFNLLIYYYFSFRKYKINEFKEDIKEKIANIYHMKKNILNKKNCAKAVAFNKFNNLYYIYWLWSCKY